ncbi:MAG: FGGY-family carbohydrate kinase [Cyanobium sp.]
MRELALGVDFGTSGVRIALLDRAGEPLHEQAIAYPGPFEDPEAWREGLFQLLQQVPLVLRQDVRAVALAGTSGTLLLCHRDGRLLPGVLGQALPYHQACGAQLPEVSRLLGDSGAHPAGQASGSLARALSLLEKRQHTHQAPPLHALLIRHQADWVMGWLLGNWRWGEEGNNLRLGWDLTNQKWLGSLAEAPWCSALPEVVPSGSVLGPLAPEVATALGLPIDCQVVAGTTDANAAVLAADPALDDGITVLGSTLVLKQFVPQPIQGVGLSCHRVNHRWLVGGASNTGTALLNRYFSPAMLEELSRQMDPQLSSGLKLRPLLGRGERFPVDDPQLEPILEPRPVSDASFLQGLLEGITAIEKEGWQRLHELGAPPIRRIITLGGGARNPQWRLLRQRVLGLPILNRPHLSAARGMACLAQGKMGTTSPLPER